MDGNKQIKKYRKLNRVYITNGMEKIGELEKKNIKWIFTPKAFDLQIMNFNGINYR